MVERVILSGDEAAAEAALSCGVNLGIGYPGTPSTEVLEHFSRIGGKAQWAPNEKVALEVGAGVGSGGGRTVVTMKHVGLNVAADPLFTLTYAGTKGAIVILVADDPGLASSQNEQDNRHYARAAKLPMLEPSDSQEAYDYMIRAVEISEKFRIPVMLRMTTRVCHSKAIVERWKQKEEPKLYDYEFNVKQRVMVPANARVAHVRLEGIMKEVAASAEANVLAVKEAGSKDLGIVCSGISYQHVKEACPEASVLKLGLTWPLPVEAVKEFAAGVKRCIAVEEGDHFLAEALRAAGVPVESKPDAFLFGELNVSKVKKLVAGDSTPDPAAAPGRPPQLCPGCPHRKSFEGLRDLNCIVAGDIGCYTLGTMPPFNALHQSLCMGASIGMGLGLRRSLKEADARRVVSVIGDSTFMHSGLTGIAEMVYNRPATGHLVIIFDNSTTAMTGLQEHSATGRALNMEPAHQISIPDVCRALGVDHVDIIDSTVEHEKYKALIQERLASNDVSVIIAKRPCILQMKKLAKFQKGGAK